ncbi:hypothetical protein JOF56_004524 [Kibdelosporangium banguiense]|uniref:Uncharacterized protein n=1 Tax=Kibdelosporangium banguiense TaxID=1365924 RepID=A0ABS4TIB5_9PSEU|nr:hypothetical protein [Kibdelosporangium banguiense]MBP2324139.1 hypothetical protein [Kibdelosporangium banguiense]
MSFRYTLPDSPIAAATADIGHVAVDLALTLSGHVQVTSASQAEARPVLDRISEGMFISGLGTEAPSVTCPAKHRFTQAGTTFVGPSTMVFSGASLIDFGEDGVAVTGDVEYRLAVTVAPHNREAEPQADAAQWFSRNGGTLASIGAIVLIGRSLGALVQLRD